MDDAKIAAELLKMAKSLTIKAGSRELNDAMEDIAYSMKHLDTARRKAAVSLGSASRSGEDELFDPMVDRLRQAQGEIQDVVDNALRIRNFLEDALEIAEKMAAGVR